MIGTTKAGMPPRLPLAASLSASEEDAALEAALSEKDAAMEALFDPAAGMRAFWRRLESENERQQESLQQHDRSMPWITWGEAKTFYRENGGTDKAKGIAERQAELDPEKKEALDEVFYGSYQGAIGQEALWHALGRYDRQKQTRERTGHNWISHRDMAAYYQTRETTQLMRNAPTLTKTRTKVPQRKDLFPLRRLQADTISLKGMPSGGFHGVINIIDLFSQFTWQVPIQTVGSASNAAAALNAAIKYVEDSYDFPADVVLQTDNGSEFGKEFEDMLDDRIVVTHGPPHTSNAQGAVENANKVWRGVMRRLLHARGARKADWSQHMGRINEIINLRPVESLGWLMPAEVLHDGLGGDDEMIRLVSAEILKRANARRTPSQVTAFRMGDRVRVVNQKYLADKLRSNLSKTNPRWSKTIFRIRTVKGADSDTMQPEYVLGCDTVCPPAAQQLLRPPQGQNNRWFPHDLLMLVHGVVSKPPAIVNVPHTPDPEARPFPANPSIAAPRRSQRRRHELEGKDIEVMWIFDDKEELRPATELNEQVYGDDDAVWFDAVIQKVRRRDVVVKYPDDDVTKHHNLLVSGVTASSPDPYENYMERDKAWRTV